MFGLDAVLQEFGIQGGSDMSLARPLDGVGPVRVLDGTRYRHPKDEADDHPAEDVYRRSHQ